MADKKIDVTILDKNTYSILNLTEKGCSASLYRIPRSSLDYFFDKVPASKQYGVYILLNKVTRQTYIGRSEDIQKRAKQHNKKKDFWTEMIAVTTKTNELDLSDIAYLEYIFYTMAKDANSYAVENNVIPSDGNTAANLTQVINFTKDCLNILGYDLFDKSEDLTDYEGSPTNSKCVQTSTKLPSVNIKSINVKPSKDIIDDLNKKDWRVKHASCKKILTMAGCSFEKAFTYAGFNEGHDYYWANPTIDVLTQDWTLALVHLKKRKIYLLSIKANTFDFTAELGPQPNTIRTRYMNNKLVLDIQINENLFYSMTQNDFSQFLTCEISF